MKLNRNMHLMVDLETLATTSDAEIISIGYCLFELGADPVLLESGKWNVKDQPDRRRAPETVRWWLQQPKEAQKRLFDSKPIPLHTALCNLTDVIRANRPTGIWANGVTFDLGILTHAFDAAEGIKKPWSYSQECCLRSIRAIAELVRLDYRRWYADDKDNVQHDAEDDCIRQVEFLIEFYTRAQEAGYDLRVL